jgi:hypothetical protein
VRPGRDAWRPRTVASVLLRIVAVGGILKTSALILFPRLVVAKAHLLDQAGFLNAVLAMCLMADAYFTWFGYFASSPIGRRAILQRSDTPAP